MILKRNFSEILFEKGHMFSSASHFSMFGKISCLPEQTLFLQNAKLHQS